MQVFLAAPFTQMLDQEGVFDPEFRAELTHLKEYLEGLGHDVFSAHTREKWGEALDTPAGALAIDLAQIDRCDIVVAVMGNPFSPGVQLELGYAIAKEKPLILIADLHGRPPYLVDGIPPLKSAAIIAATDLNKAHDAIRKALRSSGSYTETQRERGRSAGRRSRTRRS